MEKMRPWGLTILRVVVGIVFLMHGAQKFQMGFGNLGNYLGSQGIPVPGISAIVLTLAEFLGGIALLTGFFTRWVALALAFDMLVAMLKVHLKGGFFLPQGFEFVLTLLAALLTLALAGGGAAALDGRLKTRAAKI
jgi:putative oxidoreductase